MIDVSNFISNSSSPAELMVSTAACNNPDEVVDVKDIAVSDEATLDPNCFVLLMAQMLTAIPVSDTEPSVTQEGIELSGESKGELIANTVKDEVNPEPQTELDISDNVALTWINSEDYAPPQAVSAQEQSINAETLLQITAAIQSAAENRTVMPFSDKESSEMADDQASIAAGAKQSSSQFLDAKSDVYADENSDYSTTNITGQLKQDLFQSLQRMAVSTQATLAVDKKETARLFDSLIPDNNQNVSIANAPVNQSATFHGTTPELKNLDIPVHIRDSEWANRFSEHIVWLGGQNIKSAVIKIHPEDLGPLEINIKVVKDSASVDITSHSSHVRDVVEQALPRLREMMADQGLNLGEVTIGADANSRQFSQGSNNGEQEAHSYVEEESQVTPLTKKPPKGLIDYFA